MSQTPGSADLVAFLRARLDEDERLGMRGFTEMARGILAEYEEARDFYSRPENMGHPAGEVQGLYSALRHLAAMYRGYPDYQPDWKP